MNRLTPYIYDGHGHSTASDGLHEPEKIIDFALQKGLNIIGLSDHNVTKNLQRFLEYGDKVNKESLQVLTIPSVEFGSTHGDILVAIPDRNHAENFMLNYKKPKKKLQPVEIIEENIDKYDAIIVFLHPEAVWAKGLTIENIKEILEKVPAHYHKNIGIEVYNWMTQAFFWNRSKKEKEIHTHNNTLSLAPFSFTDYHDGRHVGNGSTVMYMEELSSAAFTKAVHERKTAPLKTSNRGLLEYCEIARASLTAEVLSRFAGRDFHLDR